MGVRSTICHIAAFWTIFRVSGAWCLLGLLADTELGDLAVNAGWLVKSPSDVQSSPIAVTAAQDEWSLKRANTWV